MVIQVTITLILINQAYDLIRANTFSDAVYIYTHMFSSFTLFGTGIANKIGVEGIFWCILFIFFMESIHHN